MVKLILWVYIVLNGMLIFFFNFLLGWGFIVFVFRGDCDVWV